MRGDAPGRRGGRLIGSLPVWTDEEDRQRALEALDRDAYAASSIGPNASRIRTLYKALDVWLLAPFPLPFARYGRLPQP